MGFVRGLLAPFRGAAFVARHRLWWYLVAPVLLGAALAAGTTLLAVRLVRARIGAELFATSPVVAWIALVAFAGLLGLLLFVVLQPLITAPFVDLLSEKTEAIVRGTSLGVGFFAGAWRALGHGLAKVILYALALGVGLALSALTGVGAAVGVVLYALFLAFDGFDYPLARRATSFAGKWKYLALHPGQTLGYCLGASLLYLIPLGALMAPAWAAVGATLAYLETAPADPAPLAPGAALPPETVSPPT